MITPSYSLTATERVLPRLALDFTTATLDPRVTFTRSGNTATVTNSSGVIVGVNADIPRFDYNPTTLLCNGLLIEESRTNVLLNSLLDGTSLATQTVIVTAAARTLSFYGTGQIVLSGAASATVTGTGAYPTRTTLTFTPSVGALILTVTGTVQFAQLELGSFATSFIPTAGSQVTRTADVATMTGTNFSDWYNASEGTFLFEGSVFTGVSSTKGLLDITDGTTTERMQMYVSGVTPIYFIADGGSTQAQVGTRTITVNQTFGFSAGYKENLIGTSVNAAAVQTDNTATIPTVDRAFLFQRFDGTLLLNGYARKLFYYPQRLINAELQATSKV